MTIVYGIKNKINNKLYVGSSRQKELARLKAHKKALNENNHYNKHLQTAWNKYGEENFEFIILENVNENDDQFEREQYWIDYYESYNHEKGYNGTKIAGRVEMTEEVKEKIRNTMRGRPLTPEHIKAFSQAKIGEKRTKESKEKISKAMKGKKLTEEHKNKISEGGKGKKRSEETKRKIAEARRGKKFPRK